VKQSKTTENHNLFEIKNIGVFFYVRLNHLGNVQVVVSDKRISVCGIRNKTCGDWDKNLIFACIN